MARKVKLARLFLRLGLIAVFVYAAIASLVSPEDWIGYLPSFLTAFVPAAILLKLFSAYQLLLSLWLLSDKYAKYAAIVATLTVLGIVFADVKLFAITFRDVAIASGTVALAILSE